MAVLSDGSLEKIRRRMAEYDALTPEWRALVGEYGWGLVKEFRRINISPRIARHLIEITLNGAYEIRDRRNSLSVMSRAGERMAKALSDLHLPGSGQAVAESLRRAGGVVIPLSPTEAMIRASMDALPRRQPMQWVDKRTKHRMRLLDAIQAAVEEELRPFQVPALVDD